MNTIKRLFMVSVCLCVFSTAQAGESPVENPGKFLGDLLTGGNDTEEFLDPDIAFSLTPMVQDANHVRLHWDIADGYYLYRDHFRFSVATPGISIAEQSIPPGKEKLDPEFGNVHVFYDAVDINLALQRRDPGTKKIRLTVVSQGCKEDAICYPPQTRHLELSLPAGASGEAGAFSDSGPSGTIMQSQQDRISDSLQNKNILFNVLVFFGFGLLLSLTPCIFPMIPILSGIIVGQGKSIGALQAFFLSLAYVVMMALTYAVLGVIAGSFHFNLQAAAQNAWVITLFSLVFVLLALSMFGFYELQLPLSWQDRLNRLSNRQQSGNLFGAGIMGVLSAIIVGPCVAPPLAGALIYISQTGNALLGGVALFALGMGLGAPLLIIGTSAGKLLPRAGAWMNSVKQFFGVLMLAVAVWFMGRILPASVTLFLWGLLFTVSAVSMGALERLESAGGWYRVRKGVAIVLLVYGIALVVGAAGGAKDVFRPLQFATDSAEDAGKLAFVPVKSSDQLDALLERARQREQVVMLDFYADWCITCKEMERYTFPDSEVHSALANVQLLKADVTANDDLDQELMQRFDIIGPPAILFFVNGNEQRAYRLVGFVNAGDFVDHIQQVKSL